MRLELKYVARAGRHDDSLTTEEVVRGRRVHPVRYVPVGSAHALPSPGCVSVPMFMKIGKTGNFFDVRMALALTLQFVLVHSANKYASVSSRREQYDHQKFLSRLFFLISSAIQQNILPSSHRRFAP